MRSSGVSGKFCPFSLFHGTRDLSELLRCLGSGEQGGGVDTSKGSFVRVELHSKGERLFELRSVLFCAVGHFGWDACEAGAVNTSTEGSDATDKLV